MNLKTMKAAMPIALLIVTMMAGPVPSASGQIPLALLLRALGMESDEEIVHATVAAYRHC